MSVSGGRTIQPALPQLIPSSPGGLAMDMSRESAVSPPLARSVELVRVPVRTLLYRQAMAENGCGD
ncbi:MAG: hypothetical protein ACK6BG_03435, partial [Cyanobacteriota bacterium]